MKSRARVWESLAYAGGIMLVVEALVALSDSEGHFSGTYDDIAREARLPRRASRAAVKILADDGLVEITEGCEGVNEYQLDREFLRGLEEPVEAAA